jgi:glycosyltransferase involved in cell wall biosynthesis
MERQKNKINSNNKLPRISVIVPIYNVEQYLPKCLESLAQQTLLPKDFEIILINDASPDNSFQIAKDFAKKHKNVKLLVNKRNLGLGRTRNRGIKEAKGEYLFFLDSDDYLDPIALETMLIKAYEEKADILTTGYTRVDEVGNVLGVNNSYYELNSKRIEILKKLLAHEIPSMSCARLIKKSLFIDNNIWFPKGLHEDVPVVYKLFILAKKTSGIPYSFYNWVTHKGSITSRVKKEHIDDLIKALESKTQYIKGFCENNLSLRLSSALQIGWCKVFQSKLKLIAEYEQDHSINETQTYIYIYNALKNKKEFRKALKANKRSFLYLYILFDSFGKYPSKKAIEIFKFYISDKNKLILFISKSKLKYVIYFFRKYLNPVYQFYKTIKNIFTYNGNFIDKTNYALQRILKFILKILKRKYFQRFLKAFTHRINSEIIFFCDDASSIEYSAGIIDKLPEISCRIALTKNLYRTKVNKNIKKYNYEKKTSSKLDLEKLKTVVYFTDRRDSFINDIRLFKSQGIKTVGIIKESYDFDKEKYGFCSNLYPFRIFDYLVLKNISYYRYFKDKSNVMICKSTENITSSKNFITCIAKSLKDLIK